MPSTVIKGFDYIIEKSALQVEFITGKIYLYKQVPEEVYQAMKQSFAKGIFFNEHVKDKFEFEKLN